MSLILDRVIDVHRLSQDSDNTSKESYQVYTPLANIAINWQPAGAEDTVVAQGVFGQTYIAFTTASGSSPFTCSTGACTIDAMLVQ